jgi:hypothetical protein
VALSARTAWGDNAVILDGVIGVLTTFTSNAGTDEATIAIQVEPADDVVAAMPISHPSNLWDAGLQDVIPA